MVVVVLPHFPSMPRQKRPRPQRLGSSGGSLLTEYELRLAGLEEDEEATEVVEADTVAVASAAEVPHASSDHATASEGISAAVDGQDVDVHPVFDVGRDGVLIWRQRVEHPQRENARTGAPAAKRRRKSRFALSATSVLTVRLKKPASRPLVQVVIEDGQGVWLKVPLSDLLRADRRHCQRLLDGPPLPSSPPLPPPPAWAVPPR